MSNENTQHSFRGIAHDSQGPETQDPISSANVEGPMVAEIERQREKAVWLHKFYSTSSYSAPFTISDPDYQQVIYCIAAILQAQIFDDLETPELSRDTHPEYLLPVMLPPEYGGVALHIPSDIFDLETRNDDALKERLLSGQVPTIDTIYRFLHTLYAHARYSIECNILALIYINRITTRNKLALTMNNWRGFLVAGVILAQKVWDDCPVRTADFSRFLPNVHKSQLKDLECLAFKGLDYSTNVKPSLYARYFFELRRLFQEITFDYRKVDRQGNVVWAMTPLGRAQEQRLELRSARASQNYVPASTVIAAASNSHATVPAVGASHNSVAVTAGSSPMALAAASEESMLSCGATTHDASYSSGGSKKAKHGISKRVDSWNLPQQPLTSSSASFHKQYARKLSSTTISSSDSVLGTNNGFIYRGRSKTTEDILPRLSQARLVIS